MGRGLNKYKLHALNDRLAVHHKISESGQNYIRTLFRLQDNRTNGYGIDLVDMTFSPHLFYEAKEGLKQINVYDTQLHYQNGISRSYLIMVRRIDNLKTHHYILDEKGKKRKRLKHITNEESLHLNFGDVFILPFEVVEEHYLTQRTKDMVLDHSNLVGRGKKYKNVYNLNAVTRRRIKRELEEIKSRRTSDESVSHEERKGVSLSFAQASQIINEGGPHYELIRKSKTFYKQYKREMVEGPLLTLDSEKPSYIYLMDKDKVVIDHIVSRLDVKTIDELKRQRAEFIDELRELRKIKPRTSQPDEQDLESKLEALVNWQRYDENLFSESKRKERVF